MARQVSSFKSVKVSAEGFDYAFLFVNWNDYQDDVRAELDRQAAAFGADLGERGVFVRSFERRTHENSQQVLDKPWPDQVWQRLDEDPEPVILVIATDFAEFDPAEHPYALIWLSDLQDKPQTVRKLLQVLASKTRRGEDVIGYLDDVGERARAAAEQERRGGVVGAVARVGSYFDFKPSVFGVSVDIKTILRDISQRES